VTPTAITWKDLGELVTTAGLEERTNSDPPWCGCSAWLLTEDASQAL
jgi:hypothetical protein